VNEENIRKLQKELSNLNRNYDEQRAYVS